MEINVKRNLVISIACMAVAAVLTVLIMNWSSHTLEIKNLTVFLIKLVPFFLVLAGICYFPFEKTAMVLKLLFVLFAYGVIFSYGFCKIIYLFLKPVPYEEFYLLLQILAPFIILSLVLALRCGGMKAKDSAVFGTITLIFMVSGFEDLMAQFVRMGDPGYVFPEVWAWATHMTIFVGRALNKYEAFAFIGIHFVLIALILFAAYKKDNFIIRFASKIGGILKSKLSKI